MAGVRRIYGATGLVGGSSGSLDNIDASILKFGDLAIAQGDTAGVLGHNIETDTIYFYRYANVSSVQVSPKIIKPVLENGLPKTTAGRWLLISPSYFMEDLIIESGKKLTVNEIWANDTDLVLSYGDGSVYITIGNNTVKVDAPATFSKQIISTVATGTPPLVIESTTVVANLNSERVGGNPSSNLSLLNDNTNKYTVLPQVTSELTVIPSDPKDLVTKHWVESQLSSGGGIDHGTLYNLVYTDEPTNTIIADDHTQYIRVDSLRAFDVTIYWPRVSNVSPGPTATAHLTTKKYVDDEILSKATNIHIRKDASVAFTGIPRVEDHTVQIVTQNYHLATKYYVDNVTGNQIQHSNLQGLGSDDHIQYIRVDGTARSFTGLIGYSNGTIVSGATSNNFITKAYVDTGISNITSVYIVKNGTIAFTGIPQVTNTAGVPDFGPTQPYHLVTQEYVDSVVTGGTITHSSLSGLVMPADDHTQYIHVDGRRNFTGDIHNDVGTTSTSTPYTLTTKGYVDSIVVTSHGGLADLLMDDHTQYMRVDGFRVFDTTTYFPGVSNNGSIPDDSPTQPWDLTTKEYVDAGILTLGSVELFGYVDVYGRHPIVDNQPYNTRYEMNPFESSTGADLVQREYVDYFASTFVISSGDENFGYLDTKLEFSDTPVPINIDMGSNTGIRVDKTTDRIGGITWAEITNGGSGFFVYDSEDIGYPQTFLDITNGGIFDATGVSGNDIAETSFVPVSDTNPGTGDADIRVGVVVGDVGYMEIINGGTGLVVSGTDPGWYSFSISGDGYQIATWEAYVDTGVITALRRDVTAENSGVGDGYTIANDVIYIPGITGSFTLRGYIIGTIARFDVLNGVYGDGYVSATYNLIDGTEASFVVVGEGTSGGLITGNTLNVTFHNPINEKLKISQYNPTVTPSSSFPSYSEGYTRTLGQVISSISFDEWGNITSISEAGTGGPYWSIVSTGPLTLEPGDMIFADTTGGVFTLNLPATPLIGDMIHIVDVAGNFSTANLTIGRNGELIMGLAEDMTGDVDNASIKLVYSDVTNGWRLV